MLATRKAQVAISGNPEHVQNGVCQGISVSDRDDAPVQPIDDGVTAARCIRCYDRSTHG
jgi:hypothetical protein